MLKCVLVIVFVLFSLLSFGLRGYASPIVIPVTDPRFNFVGRWRMEKSDGDPVQVADWPCSEVKFSVQVGAGGGELPLVWYGLRSRVNLTAYIFGSRSFVFHDVLIGPSIGGWFGPRTESYIKFPQISSPRNYTLHLQKLTTAAPFGPGLGLDVFRPSVLRFFGIGTLEGNTTLIFSPPPKRRIVAIGGSDTAGYCVDGTPEMKGASLILKGWEYVNCEYAYAGVLSRVFDAEVSVQAISGIGLTQNAKTKEKWQLGKLTMPAYFNRTLQTTKDFLWNFEKAMPTDLVTVSLGGNDFNHQEGNVPSNATFTRAMSSFLSFLFDEAFAKSRNTVVVAVCGMGSPNEVVFDPDNNRCRPCPHVETGVDVFRQDRPDVSDRLHYIFVPCDGSVVTGKGDIGCDGHKNRIGQGEVAEFLAPKLASILGW